MKVISFFYRYNPKKIILVSIFSIISGLTSGVLLAFINQVISNISDISYFNVIVFILLVLIQIILNRGVSSFIIKFTHNLVEDIRFKILYSLNNMSYIDFEKIGQEQIYMALIRDTNRISTGSYAIITALSSVVTLVACLIYILWLYPMGFILTFVFASIGLFFYIRKQSAIMQELEESRNIESEFFTYIKDFTSNFHEFKISISKTSDIFHKYFYPSSRKSKKLVVKNLIKFVNNNTISQFLIYSLIGVVIFIFPQQIGKENSQKFLFSILYIIGPISVVANSVPTISLVSTSINHIEKILVSISNYSQLKLKVRKKNSKSILIETISYKNIVFQYYDDSDNKKIFKVGPINLKLEKGQKYLIYGKNGSGKSTIVKIITGLYKPYDGEVLINNEVVKDFSSHQDIFSLVLRKSYISKFLYGLNNSDESRVIEFLELMKLTKLTNICRDEERYFITNLNLSSGQEKRLLLLIKILENRSIIVLDEWESEQDSSFKKVFFEIIIPYLQRLGKIIIVVSHDEKYFSHFENKILVDDGEIKV